MAAWRRFTAEGNLDGLLSLLADDVIFLTPGNPPITRDDFAKGFREVSAKAHIETEQDVKDYGPPAEADEEAEPEAGTSGADEGVSPWAPEAYEPEPEGPTTSTED